jgi:outer membrane protein assembly factor BamB/subtilisin family serine protease
MIPRLFSFPCLESIARPLRHSATLAISLALTCIAAAQTQAAAGDVTEAERRQGFSSRSLLAKPKVASSDHVALSEANEGTRVRRSFPTLGDLRIIEPNPGETVLEAMERLRSSGRYEYVEPDYVVAAEATPNDPQFLAGNQWALRNIGQSGGTAGADVRAEAAWDVQSSAADVIVAVIDSGIRTTHEDLVANLWVNTREIANNGTDDDRNGYIDDVHGINAAIAANMPGNGSPVDAADHGTSVASVIGAVGNNGLGMTGVAWNVKLMPLRFIGANGFGLVSDEIECIDYAIARGAHIINASFGGSTFSQSLYDAMKRARDARIIVVCSAGNDSENNDTGAHYPSGYLLDNIIAVANTTRTDALSASSAFGSGMIELGAPGTSILTAGSSGDRAYRFASGTSFSAPMVTGAIALLKARFPSDSYRETINRLLRGVDPLPSLAGKTISGGRLNLSAALRATTARPFNDDFAGRATFSGETGTSRGGVRHATREAGEPVHAGIAGQGSLWWTWTAPRSGSVSFDTKGSNFDTLLAVYTGSRLDALTSVSANDNDGSAETSRVSFNAVAGTAYHIAVDAKALVDAPLVALNATLLARNDAFDAGQRVAGLSWSVRSDNRAATRETGEPRIRSNAGGNSVWFRWVAPATRRYHITSFSSQFNTMLGVFTGNTVNSLTELASSLTSGDSNITISPGAVTINATAGMTYHIVVDSEVSSSGASTTGEFSLSCIDSEWEVFGFGDMSTVAVADDGSLMVGDSLGYLYAFNAEGSRKWRYPMTGYGTFSTPTVGPDGVTYIGDDLNYLHAVNPNGTRKWRFQAQGAINASPAVAADGTVYIRSDDGRLHAIDSTSGVAKWSFRMGATNSVTYASPAVAPDGTIYCAGADSRLYAITPDGALKWQFSTDFIYSTPAIGSDGTIYFGTAAPTRRFFALRPDGTVRWEFVANDTVSSSPAIGPDGSIFFGCADQTFYALSPAGEVRWTYLAGGPIRNSSPIVASDGSVLIGSLDGKVYCLEPDGTLRRIYATAEEVRASPVLHNGRLYIGSYDYRLYAIETGQVAASSAWPMQRQNLRRTSRSVTSPLTIAVQPQHRSAEVGETITFSVGALGTAPLTYQWSFNGQAIVGATNQSYRVDPVTHGSRGQFSVRVSDSTGALTSNPATMTVTTPLVAPSVFAAPAARTVTAGDALTLSVAALGTEPFTYQWLRNGQPVAGATNATLTFANPKPTDSGNYAVTITNQVGQITSTAAAVAVNPLSRISNLSIRSRVGGTSGLLTVGLTIGGVATTGDKVVLLRAVGPTLAAFGVEGALLDPQLSMLRGETSVARNDDWAGNPTVVATSAAVGAFNFAEATSKDAALVHTAPSGSYTVQIGSSAESGVALAEVYDTTPANDFGRSTPRLTNVSALTRVGTGGDILIAGFSISGTLPKTVLVRGIGPTLAAFGVAETLSDPRLELYQNGIPEPLAANDNWGAAINTAQVAAAATSVAAFALAPDSRDSALLISLPPGSYTAQISGVNSATGAALVEVYEIPTSSP